MYTIGAASPFKLFIFLLSKILLINQMELVAFQIIEPNWNIDLGQLKNIWLQNLVR